MKIALINGSPKKADSASEVLLSDLKSLLLSADNTMTDFTVNNPAMSEDEMKALFEYNVWIFAFPLYVDGIPSHLLSYLCRIEQLKHCNKDIHVYAIVNSGFYEGRQNCNAIAILKNWCNKAGFHWGMGIGYGGGGALLMVKDIPLGKGPKSGLQKTYQEFSKVILSETSADDIYTNITMPHFLYKMGAEMGWNQLIKANGGKKQDLERRL